MASHALMKLGRTAPSLHQRAMAIPLGRHLKKPLPKSPAAVDHVTGAPIQVFGNDRYGNCTFAALGNFEAIASKIEHRESVADEEAIIKAYLDFTNGEDEGAVEIDVLNGYRDRGYHIGGKDVSKLAAWVSVPVSNTEARSSLVAIFGALYLGVALPTQAQVDDVWAGPPNLHGDYRPGSWGGHCLLEGGYDSMRRFLVTWGERKLAEETWIRAYCDEAYVLLDARRAEMIDVDWAALLSDLQNVPVR